MSDISGTRLKLRRIKGKHWVGGVCAGVGYRLGLATWLVRLLWTVSILAYGFGILLYVLLWIFMPAWERVPEDYEERAGG